MSTAENDPGFPDYENMQALLKDATGGMFDNYEKKILDLKNLLRITGLVNSTLNFKEMMDRLLFSTQGTIIVSSIAIFFMESIFDDTLVLRASVGLSNESMDIEIQESEPLIQKVAADGVKSIFFNEICNNPDYKDTLDLLMPLEPELLVPMKNKDKLVGLMIFGAKLSGDVFTNSEIEFLTNVADFASMAAENIRLFEMATMDRMTNLYVHHYFQNRLEEEIARALRYNAPLSLLMFDIDHFKPVNDTHGHQAGDIIIKGIANLIRENLRKLDLPARYGGEEFAVILPESDSRMTVQVAERIRSTIERTMFSVDGGKKLSVTISAGVAELRTVCEEKSDLKSRQPLAPFEDNVLKDMLIRNADKALYHSKHSGRNRVTVFTGDGMKTFQEAIEVKVPAQPDPPADAAKPVTAPVAAASVAVVKKADTPSGAAKKKRSPAKKTGSRKKS